MTVPYCLAMVLCDALHVDPGTRKFTILGTFTNFLASSFPAPIQICAYFAITDGTGSVTLRLQLVDASQEPVSALNEGDDPARVFLAKQLLTLESPLIVAEGGFGVLTAIPKEGLYHCELWGDGEILMSRRLTATKAPASNEEV